jgi:hypothetical protein
MMKRISQKVLLVVALLSISMSVGLPAGAAADGQGSSQQDKAKACNSMADNKGLKGDDRKNFMQDCLSKAGNQQLNDMSRRQLGTLFQLRRLPYSRAMFSPKVRVLACRG